MKTTIKTISFLILGSALLFSCVPQRKYLDVKDKQQKCEDNLKSYKAQLRKDTIEIKELKAKLKALKKERDGLVRDTTVLNTSLRTLTKQYDKINALNNELLNKQKLRSLQDAEEIRKLLADLQKSKDELQAKEDALRELEKMLNQKKQHLEALKAEIDRKNAELDRKDSLLTEKNKKLIELQQILNKKDSVVEALRKTVADALLGFKNQGLNVEIKNGKVYVSLQEKLLFKSGRWDIDPRGKEALKKLAKVLEENPDINIMVVGHTDDVPYHGSGGIEDNWDLSTKRATAVVKYILANSKIDPKRLTAAGHGEYMPVDPAKTKEARAKNRRTEIILTPKLDELFKIMETN